MSILVTFNGTGYLIPTSGETGWGNVVTNFLSDVGNNALTVVGAQSIVPAAASFNNVGRNALLNGLLTVQQRGTGPFTTANYTADRWALAFGSGGSRTYNLVAISDADRAVIGDEEAQFALQAIIAGGSAAGDFEVFFQNVENLRRFGGKTVTLSFWAKGGGSFALGARLIAQFGTGGSPSASVPIAGQSFIVGTTMSRHSMTFTVPSTSGQTFGTNNDSSLGVFIGLSSGSTNSAAYGGLGVHSAATLTFWGFQLELASVATQLEKRNPENELALCQRFYQIGQIFWTGQVTSGITFGLAVTPTVTMRASASMTVINNANVNIGAPTLSANASSFSATGVASATGQGTINIIYAGAADL